MSEYWGKDSEDIFYHILELLEPYNEDELWEFIEDLNTNILSPSEAVDDYMSKKVLYDWLKLIEAVTANLEIELVFDVDTAYDLIDQSNLSAEQKSEIEEYYHQHTSKGNKENENKISDPPKNNNNNSANNPSELQEVVMEGGKKKRSRTKKAKKTKKSKKTKKLRKLPRKSRC